MDKIFSFICCGSVDDGKSTLIGRLLLDSGNVKIDQLQEAEKISKRNGSNRTELSLLSDGLLSEREQQITIDVAHRYFDYNNIRFHILDCPGHKQYTRNMVIAAAMTNTALLVVDCMGGIQEQTLKHIDICSLLRVQNLCICITKCDLLQGDLQDNPILKNLCKKIDTLMKKYNFNYTIIPISSVSGYNIDKVFNQIYTYAQKVLETQNKKCILHIQAARLSKDTRFYYARETTHTSPEKGENYTLYPANIGIGISNVTGHGVFNIDSDIDVERGDCITNTPVLVHNILKQKTIWFNEPSEDMLLKHGTRIVKIKKYTDDLIETDDVIIFNDIDDIKENGFAVIIDNKTKRTIGCCVFIDNKRSNQQTTTHKNEDESKKQKLKSILASQGFSQADINKMIASIK